MGTSEYKKSGKKPFQKPFGTKKTSSEGGSRTKSVPVKEAVPRVPSEWLYMTPQEVTVTALEAALSAAGFSGVEVWTEAGVLEIPLADKASLDLEQTEAVMEDDYSNAFLKENDIHSLFLVTLVPAEYEKAKSAMLAVTASCGGFFCGDTDDFTPVVR